MNESDHTELIERFLNKDMPVEEASDLVQRIKSNPELADEYKRHVIAVTYLKQGESQENQKLLDEIERNFQQSLSKKRNLRIGIGYFSIAAAIAIFALFFLPPFFSKEPNTELLSFATLFDAKKEMEAIFPLPNTRDNSDLSANDSLLIQANELHIQGKSEEATIILTQLLTRDYDRDNVAFHLGLLFLVLAEESLSQDSPEGEIYLRKAEEAFLLVDDSVFARNDKLWYLTLSYVGQNKKEEARTTLSKIDTLSWSIKNDEIRALDRFLSK